MSDHDELADRLEQDAERLQHESDRLEQQGESARSAVEQAQQDEYTPAPLGEDDPAYREPSEAERKAAEEQANQPPPPSTPGEKVDDRLRTEADDMRAGRLGMTDEDSEDNPNDREADPPTEDADEPAAPKA